MCTKITKSCLIGSKLINYRNALQNRYDCHWVHPVHCIFLVNKKISFITFIFSKNVILYRMYLVSYWLKIIFILSHFHFSQGLIVFMVQSSIQAKLWTFLKYFLFQIFLRFFFVSDFSSYLLTFWPLFPMIYLIFKMFHLFCSWPLQKRSKTKELWLW